MVNEVLPCETAAIFLIKALQKSAIKEYISNMKNSHSKLVSCRPAVGALGLDCVIRFKQQFKTQPI